MRAPVIHSPSAPFGRFAKAAPMNASEKLTDAIDQLVREKTFGLDALDAIRGLKDKAAAADAKVEKLTADLDASKRQATAYYADLGAERAKVAAATEREASLVKREAAVFESEKAKAVAEAKASTIYDAFAIVFRNTVVRENSMRNVAVPGSNGMQSYTVSIPETSVKSEEPDTGYNTATMPQQFR